MLTTMLKPCVALGAVPLAAVIVPLNVPAAVGVPEMTPVELIVRPVGRPGAYSNVSSALTIPGVGLVTTNYLEVNGALKSSRFYRMKYMP